MRSQTSDVPRGKTWGEPEATGQPRGRGTVTTWIAILMSTALPLIAEPAAATYDRPSDLEKPRFYIERIAVEGVRHASPEVILSESLLEEGIAYTESELRQAAYRVNRLPFVLESSFSLDRGSERGRFSLLITVEEVRRLFLGSDLTYTAYGDALATDPSLEDGLTDGLSAGLRVFAGRGVFFAAVGDDENLQVGYERYKLLDRPVLLRFAYAREGCCSTSVQELGLDPGAAVWTAADESDRLELTVGLPLGGNHSLRFDAAHLETGSAVRRPLDSAAFAVVDVRDVEQRELELAWVFDSTDDPVFPSRGDALTAAVGLRLLEGDLSEPLATGSDFATATLPIPAAELSSRLIGLSFFGARHWPLSPRQTVSLSLKLLLSRSEVANLPVAPEPNSEAETGVPLAADTTIAELWSGDVDVFEAGAGVRYSQALWGPGKTRRLGELRWETLAELIYAETSPVVSLSNDPLWGVRLSTGVALRNAWGIFRFGFTFLDYDGEL